jgi:hypothetical protein
MVPAGAVSFVIARETQLDREVELLASTKNSVKISFLF